MATELSRVSSQNIAIQSDPNSGGDSLLYCGDKAYRIGKLKSLYVAPDTSLHICSGRGASWQYSFEIPAQGAQQFVSEFMKTWGDHQACLVISDSELNRVDYEPSTSKWTYTWDRASSKDLEGGAKLCFSEGTTVEESEKGAHVVETLKELPLQAQIEKVRNLLKVMHYKIDPTDDFSSFMALSENIPSNIIAEGVSTLKDPVYFTVKSKGPGSNTPYDPFRTWTYQLKEGQLTCQNLLSHIAEDMRNDRHKPSPEVIADFISALDEMGGQFPLEEPLRLGNVIREIPRKVADREKQFELVGFLKRHLHWYRSDSNTLEKVAGEVEEFAKTVDDSLQKVRDCQLYYLLPSKGSPEEEKKG